LIRQLWSGLETPTYCVGGRAQWSRSKTVSAVSPVALITGAVRVLMLAFRATVPHRPEVVKGALGVRMTSGSRTG